MIHKPSKKILRTVGKTNAHFELIKEGDKVLVGFSGGKDSLTLLHCLKHMQAHAPFAFDYEAVTIRYGMEGEDYSFLTDHCEKEGIRHSVYDTNIYEVAQDTIRKNSSFCSYFSRMRRGALYTYAADNGFNKVALGHHFDDAAESFFMNMFYNGTMRSMAPIYKAQRGFHVIRPLIELRERQCAAFASENNVATIGDEACPGMKCEVKMPHARQSTKEWLAKMEEDNNDIFKMIKSSFKHIHDDTFLDKSRHKRDDICL
ncbi:MAG: tRNA 2-thiocytidine biosynthesis TtcA family protein [Campylobacterota bacterium]